MKTPRTTRSDTPYDWREGDDPVVLGIDPSLRATGWAIVRADRAVIAAGVIRTKSDPKSKELKARRDGDDGLYIFSSLSWVIAKYSPLLVCQEANGGSKSNRAASGLARAQQACLCASASHGLETLLCSPAALKRDVCAKYERETAQQLSDFTLDKDVVRVSARGLTWAPWKQLLAEAPGYPGGKAAPPSLQDNMFDAMGAVLAHWEHPLLKEIHRE